MTMAIVRRDPFNAFRGELDNMFAEMENRFQSFLPGFPAYSQSGRELAPVFSGGFTVDVKKQDDQVIAKADLPGCNKENVKIRLIRPNLLQISCERMEEKEQDEKDFYIRERFFGSVSRSVPLPAEVAEEGASATFENGVLEVTLKTTGKESRGDIPIQ
jgi:HSP20 family protein